MNPNQIYALYMFYRSVFPFQQFMQGTQIPLYFDQTLNQCFCFNGQLLPVPQQNTRFGIVHQQQKQRPSQKQEHCKIETQNENIQHEIQIVNSKVFACEQKSILQLKCEQTFKDEIHLKQFTIENNQKSDSSFQFQIQSIQQKVNHRQKISKKGIQVKKNNKKIRKLTKNKNDTDSKKVGKKKQSGHWKRTILPNFYQTIFAYLTRKLKSQESVKKLFDRIPKPNKKHSHLYTLERYYQYQGLLKEKLVYRQNDKKFALLKQLHDPYCSNYQLEEQMYYNKISRTVAKSFIWGSLLPQFLQKQKLKSLQQNESDEFYLKHLQEYRSIQASFIETFKL